MKGNSVEFALDSGAEPFHHRREALSIENGCVIYADGLGWTSKSKTSFDRVKLALKKQKHRLKLFSTLGQKKTAHENECIWTMQGISLEKSATIDKIRYLCSRHGLPETLVTDNGTQFTSNEFKEFTKTN
ncbi:hypothetical protein niasHS_000311 [Heterodera schachtii]|uniref:Integrase catalytic domain-containing protein n=1 Tax=Heterodera schachtii TaxID=97005 RepID=A0ABD2KM33_HETSC